MQGTILRCERLIGGLCEGQPNLVLRCLREGFPSIGWLHKYYVLLLRIWESKDAERHMISWLHV